MPSSAHQASSDEAAEGGNAQGQYNLGICYHNGEGGAKDYAEAMKWFRRAAEQGLEQAQCLVGLGYYAQGEGVTKDLREALTWYRKAAVQGVASAQAWLVLGLDHAGLEIRACLGWAH